jgi:hypothetical protein
MNRLANAKTAAAVLADARPYRPFCRRLYATARHFDSSCCVSQILCLFNYPRDAIAPRGQEHRGAIVETISLRPPAERWATSASLPSRRLGGVEPRLQLLDAYEAERAAPGTEALASPAPDHLPSLEIVGVIHGRVPARLQEQKP